MPEQIRIGVIGETGAGKTTFICKATGQNDLQVGHGLHSCTQNIQMASMRLDGKDVVLIDTPGFNDSEKTDVEILELLAENLSVTYEAGKLLHGIILLQPITANRWVGAEAKRTRLFKKICGENAFPHVVIASTMWEDVSVGNRAKAEELEAERKNTPDFWGRMLQRGARATRHMNTAASAQQIIRMLLPKGTVALQLQTELHNNGGQLSTTQAGVQLHSDLDDISRKILAEMEKTRRENDLSKQEMRDEIRELNEKLQALQAQKQELETKKISWPRRTIQAVSTFFDNVSFHIGDAIEDVVDQCTIM